LRQQPSGVELLPRNPTFSFFFAGSLRLSPATPWKLLLATNCPKSRGYRSRATLCRVPVSPLSLLSLSPQTPREYRRGVWGARSFSDYFCFDRRQAPGGLKPAYQKDFFRVSRSQFTAFFCPASFRTFFFFFFCAPAVFLFSLPLTFFLPEP